GLVPLGCRRRGRPPHCPPEDASTLYFLSHNRSPAARGHDRRGSVRDLSILFEYGPRRIRLVRRRSADGVRVPWVPSARLAGRRLVRRRPSSRHQGHKGKTSTVGTLVSFVPFV